MFQGVGGFFAKHAAGQLIRVGCNPKAARMWGKIREKSEPVFLTSFIPLFPSLSISRPHPFTVSLDHALQNSSHDVRGGERKEKKKRKKKSGSGRPIFFSHSSRRQRVVVLSSVRRGAGPDGEAGPCRETQPLRTGSAAEAMSCKRLVIPGRKAANEP